MRQRGSAALGDGWHVGIVTEVTDETAAVLRVLGIAVGRRFHTGRMAVPGGVTYLVATPPAGRPATAVLTTLRDRYDPAVVVVVGSGARHVAAGRDDVVLVAGAPGPADDAAGAFFSAAGEPATLPGLGGTAPFRVFRGAVDAADSVVIRFCAGSTTRRGKPLAWVVVRGVDGVDGAVNAAQVLRYFVPYLRPRL